MLSTEKSCLAETGYQLTFRKVYIVATGAPLNLFRGGFFKDSLNNLSAF